MRPLEHRIDELLVEDVLLDEVDQRVGLRVDVVLVEQHLGVLEHLAQSPCERRHVVEQRLVRAQRVQRHAVRLVRREVLDVGERIGGDAALLVERAVRFVDLAWLVEVAEVGALHVEAHRGDAPLLRREVREDRLQQPLHGARLRRQTGDAADVQVRRLGTDEEVGVEIDRRVGAAGAVDADRDPRARTGLQVAVHPQRDRDVRFVGEEDGAHRHRLQRLLGHVAQHGRGVEPDLGSTRLVQRLPVGRAVESHHVVQRRREVGPAEALRHDAVHERHDAVHRVASVDAHDRPDADRRVERGPEMELVRSVRASLGGDDATEN